MSKNTAEIKQLIERMGGAHLYEIIDGTVDSVNEEDYSVDVKLAEDVVLPDVRLRAVSNGGAPGLVCLPKVGSYIVFCQIRGAEDYILIKTSELDKIIVDVGVKLELNASETVFNGGNNDGLPFAGKVVQRLNKLESDINSLKQIIAWWTPASQDGGAALKTASSSWAAQLLQATVISDIENNKIKQ